MMKKSLLSILLFASASALSIDAAACTGGSFYGSLSPTSTWQTASGHSAGYYYTFNGVAGTTYQFSYCTTEGGAASFDTELTILNAANQELQYNDDYCSTQSFISWTCPSNGTYRILTTEYGCGFSSPTATLAYSRLGCVASSQYPSGTQNANESPIPLLVTDCNYAGEYYSVSLPPGHTFEFTSSDPNDHLVVMNSTNTTAFIEGTQPLTGNTNANTSPIVVNVHVFTNSSCGTESVCRESRVTCTSCPVPEPTAFASNNDFCAGEEIQLTAQDTFGTVSWHEGSCNGTTVGTGYQVDVTPMESTTYYVKNSYGGQSSGCFALDVDVRESAEIPMDETVKLCTGFTATLDAGNPGSTYLWWNGSTSQTLTVGSGGAFWVQVTTEDGCTTEFNGTIQEELCLGQEELEGQASLSVFPNPTQGELSVQWSGADKPSSVTLYNSTGQRVYMDSANSTGTSMSFDLGELPKGVYLVNVAFQGHQVTKQVILH